MTRQRSLSPFLFQIVGPLSRAAGAGFLISSAMRQYQRPEFRLGYVHPHTVQEDPQRGPQWLHELKHDGYRLVARRVGDQVRLFMRGGDWTDRYPRIVGALDDLRAKSVTIDGEAVVCRPMVSRISTSCTPASSTE
jgi:hypothetical protein